MIIQNLKLDLMSHIMYSWKMNESRRIVMLVLSRKLNESIIIDNNIEIKLVQVKSKNQVRLAIEAPRDITILRKEVKDERK